MAVPMRKPTEDLEMQIERAAFLSGPPRSGELSPYAQMLAAEVFVWLASVVVFGATVNFASSLRSSCSTLCVLGILIGVFSFLISSIVLFLHYLIWSNKVDKSSWFTPRAEMRILMLLTMFWTVGVSLLSSVEESGSSFSFHTTGVGIMFSWLALFGSIFGSYKAYHASKEEQNSLRYQQVQHIEAVEDDELANFS